MLRQVQKRIKDFQIKSIMQMNKRTKESTGQSVATSGKIGGAFEIEKDPAYIQHRLAVYERVKGEQEVLRQSQVQRSIQVSLMLHDGEGTVEETGQSFQTTVLELVKKAFKPSENDIIVCRVKYTNKDSNVLEKAIVNTGPEAEDMEIEESNKTSEWELYDLTRPLEGDCLVELLNWQHPLGKMVFWHSSAHVLGECLEQNYGGHLCIGPPLQSGFYYDTYMGEHQIKPEMYPEIEAKAEKNIKENQRFERVVLSKAQALEMFQHNPFKVQLIESKIADGGQTTAYRCGQLIDLCTGPHILNTGRIKALKVVKNSGAYWMGKATNDSLQRVYGISFQQKKQMEEYNRIQEELAKYDHRLIGKQQDLFFFSPLAPGCAFFTPTGTVLYNNLMHLIKRQYWIRGYKEVMTPNMFNINLWKTSGHYGKYNSNMFFVKISEASQDGKTVEEVHGLKPMNCPAHCLMFDNQLRSYKELPLKFADFGVLHRNELTGALSGLTRVRRFQQDDAHIFVRPDQIQKEILEVLNFIDYVYGLFGFEYKLELSTKPEVCIGDQEMWDNAEKQLSEALAQFGRKYRINPGDGAFYGPKIDIKLFDTMKREHQCGTIQLDFNSPVRFNLQYRTQECEAKEDNVEEKVVVVKKEKKPKVQKLTRKEKIALKEQEEKDKAEGKVEEKEEKEEEKKEEKKEEKAVEVKKEGHLKNGFARPVVIHRAILGSVERFMAICCEHFKGKWPFQISPKQVVILSISEKFTDYAEQVHNRMRLEGFNCDLDITNATLNKKVRNAQNNQYVYIAVVGKQEEEEGQVDVRFRDQPGDNKVIGKFSVDAFVRHLQDALVHENEKNQKNQLIAKAYFNQANELSQWNDALKHAMFLEGDGFVQGAKDAEVFQKIKETPVDKEGLPNLYRWKEFMSRQ